MSRGSSGQCSSGQSRSGQGPKGRQRSGPIPNPHPPTGKKTVAAPAARDRDDSAPKDAHGAARDGAATKQLVVYLVCEPETPELAAAAVAGGADAIELGFPFSDPLAEGPVIQRASERALSRGMRTAQCLDCLAEVRSRVEVPLIPMTYAAILEAYGYARFAAAIRERGATSAIVVDLPLEAHPEIRRIQLVAPTSTDERIAAAAARTDGWLYLVSVTGTTGARAQVSPALPGLVERARRVSEAPLYAGFGISTPEHARAAAELADGVVVGSRAVQVAAEGGPGALRDFVSGLRAALDATDA